ncbi:hypothetical protein PM082_022159 [Marasmius tenuissimus]|nr:hypothetical protein PM082_022159 [Marasmius tenuissimus]
MVTLSLKETDYSDALPQVDGPNADIIIRTSDDVDFRVHTRVLSSASPFFRQVFAGPKPPPRYSGTLDRFPISENSRTFRHLVLFMYPGTIHPRPSGWEESKPLSEAFLKYEMGGSEAFKRFSNRCSTHRNNLQRNTVPLPSTTLRMQPPSSVSTPRSGHTESNSVATTSSPRSYRGSLFEHSKFHITN